MTSQMKYPRHIVGAVIIEKQCLLMVKNGTGPRVGRWGFPGGSVEWGETLTEALKRELREECNLEVEVLELYRLSDFIVRHADEVTDHFILSHHLCQITGGELRAGSDATDVRWIHFHDLEEIRKEGGIIDLLLASIIQTIRSTQETS
jgi:mutator protein MutT